MIFLLEKRFILLLIPVFVSLFTMVYFFIRGKKTPLLYSYLLCQGMISLWSGAYLIEMMAVDRWSKWVISLVEYVPICFIVPSWLVFCLYYSEHRIIKNKQYLLLIFTLPAVFYLSVFTNDYHRLFYTTFELAYHVMGPLFWAHSVLTYLYAAVGVAILLRYSSKQKGYAKKQSLLLVFAFLVPLLSNFLYITNIVKTSYDLTPVSFSVSLLLFSIATFRYRFLNIIPLALRKSFDSMKEAVIVVDSQNKITAFNRSFSDTFPFVKIAYDDDIRAFTSCFRQQTGVSTADTGILDTFNSFIDNNVSGEILISSPVKAYYAVGIRPIKGRKGQILGKVISFNDISEYKSLLEALSIRNQELSDLNRQLEMYAATVEELTLVKERNRFARDAHDTIGHTMTVLISLLEVGKITAKDDPVKTEEKISHALVVAKEGLEELRRSVRGLMSEKTATASLPEALHQMIMSFKNSCEDIEFSVDGIEQPLRREQHEAVFRTCQEALTNSIRHGKARHINVILRYTPERVRLFVIDDGCGCKEIHKGVGLSGMIQRATALQGSIAYGSDGESGFNIRLDIPLEVHIA